MEQKHTSEPWRLTTDWEEPGHVYITGVEGGEPNECVVRFDDDYGSPQGQNAKRIVAAVNHAEGYTNEQLKAVSMKDMITNIENLHHIASFVRTSPDPDINRQVKDATINAAKLLSYLRGIEAQS